MIDDVHLMTGAYVLDSLTQGERAEFEQHLGTCERCGTEVRELGVTLAEVATAEAAIPPGSLRDRVLAQVTITPQLPPVSGGGSDITASRAVRASSPSSIRHDQPPRRAWRMGALLAGAAAVAAIAFGIGSWSAQRTQQTPVVAPADEVARIVAAPDARMSTFRSAQGADSKVIVAPSMGAAVIMAKDVPMPPEGMIYQAWVMDRAGAKHGMETFVPTADGAVESMIHGDFADATRLEVTVEPMGGSDEPSSRPIAVAALA